MLYHIIRPIFALLTASATLSAASVAAQGRPAGVITDTVKIERFAETVSVFGELIARRESRVATRIAGVADAVSVRVGDRVIEGEILAAIDSELLDIQVAIAQAELAVAEAAASTSEIQVQNARTAYQRAVNLRSNSIISDAVYEERQSALAVAVGALTEAETRVTAAKVALRRAAYDLDNSTVKAPFDGVVIAVGTEVGEFLSSGTEVARLIDIDGVEVEANVPARYVDALQEGTNVEAYTDAGGDMVLKLRATLPTEFSATRTRPVVFDVVSKEGTLAAGQSVTLNIPISAPRDVTAVPKDALIRARGGWQVFLAVDGKALPRPIQIGSALGDRYEVLSGISEGDVVVIRGNERLRPGQEIAPRPTDAAPVRSGRPGSGLASESPKPDQQAAVDTSG
ncbi:efflux RND transporter periplasmic adaptor subunit [Cognatishimia sp.]|uniref:efflux RND transporter periplasmic adaptor subunit n=1 Tax=Cognatishimia sp. TaxID=2211648 RepID=UPI003516C9FB|nr:efflux RND transporter periplasmic adaptor subunit [Cognatishimia sp.]